MAGRTPDIAALMQARAKRMGRGWLLTGTLLAGLQIATSFRLGAVAFWQSGGTLLFFAGLGWAYSLRSQMIALRGHLVTARVTSPLSLFGSEAMPPSNTQTPFNVASGLWGMLMTWWGGLLPTSRASISVPVKGKERYADLYLFPDEEPVATAEGSVLCVVAPDLWFYPPSPWVIRLRRDDPDFEPTREATLKLLALAAEAGERGLALKGGDPAARSRATRNMWLGAGAMLGLVWLFYLPFILDVPALVLPIIGTLTLLPIVLGVIRWRRG